MGVNDGGIKRGDRADTGDLQARKKDGVSKKGSGVPGGDGGATGHPTGAADAEAEPVDEMLVDSEDAAAGDDTLDDLSIRRPDDPSLGLTNLPRKPHERRK